MAQITKGVLDDALPTVKILDFTGGLNTMEGAFSLSTSETPACQNVLGFPGRALYIGGTNNDTPLPAGSKGDGGKQFYDANNNKHVIVWANGNMYDTVNGTQVLIASNVYIPGQNIGRTVAGDASNLTGILYWSTLTVPMRFYDGAVEGPVVTSGAAGSVAIPASDYLCTYAGSVIAANPVIAGSKNPGSLIPSNTNDPTTFIGANLAALGNNNVIKALIPMSVEAGGIPPTSSIMCVGALGLVLAQGPTTALKLQNINYPIGCQDGNSVVYIPTGDLLGNVVYLGTDNQFHESNGITTKLISEKILNLMNVLISNALASNVAQRFSATYNKEFHYYVCDMGQDIQMAYKWTQLSDGSTHAGFFMINGWPSGVYFDGTSGNGLPTNYVAANSGQADGLYEVGLDGTNFNGTQPVIFYNTPFLHANDVSMMKEWQWCNLSFNNQLQTQYTIDSVGMTNSQNVTPVGNQIVFGAPINQASAGSGAIWDQSNWDNSFWAGLPTLPSQGPVVDSKMLTAPVVDGYGNQVNMPLRSPSVSFKISWKPINSKSVAYYDITNFSTRYKTMGHYMAGGAPGSSDAA